MKHLILLTTAAAIGLYATAASAAEERQLVIKNHLFEPATLEIPRNTKVKLIVKNKDTTPEEFESYSLNREKIIKGNSEAVVWVGPLKKGEYKFFGEFHAKTAQGKIIVK